MRRFEGRTAIVTGGSSGIGRAIAHRLASEGSNLVLVAAPEDAGDLLEVERLLRPDVGIVSLAADIGEAETSRQAVKAALESFGRLDFVANNAGIGPAMEVFDETAEIFDRTMQVNVRGMYLLALEAARTMKRSEGGAMVFTASTASFMGEEIQVSYNVSKGAVLQLVRSLGVALAPYGIRVNAVAPGWIRTRPVEESFDDPAAWARVRSRIPADRPGAPEEVAGVVAFLFSDDASYVTGAMVVCDGGHTAGWRGSDWAAVERESTPRPRPKL